MMIINYHSSQLIIGAIVAILVLPTTIPVSASEEKPEQTQIYVGDEESGFYREDGYPRDTKNRPAINPDFAPDRSCDLKWELKCIPGSEQSCFDDLRGYNNGEMNVCTPIGCPDGYHDNFEWEDNVCYSKEIDCQDDWVLVKGAYGDTCEPEQTQTYFGMHDLSQYGNGKEVDCDSNPNHPFCNGKRGQDGVIFCELRDRLPHHMGMTCWDNNEYEKDDPGVYCAYDPETKEDCKIN